MSNNPILVAIPTYNEKENVPLLYTALKALAIQLDILFIDDNSPDGTGKIIDELVQKDETVHVLHRPKKMGLGTAHKEAFKIALGKKYTWLVTMDADFTHNPAYIPQMLQRIKEKNADIVIGSRYVFGGSMSGWGIIRLPFTHFWRGMIKYGLGMSYDCTGAFRIYRVSFLSHSAYEHFSSRGFSFCMESLYYFKKEGARIDQVPIKAENRIHGQSKLSINIMTEVAGKFFTLFADRIGTAVSRLFRK